MYSLFQQGLSRMELRALQEWARMSTSFSANPSVAPSPTSCIHLTPKLQGMGPTYRLQLLIRNIAKTTIQHLHLSLHCSKGKLSLCPSCKKTGFLFPGHQRWLQFDISDQSGQGGQLLVDVVRDMHPDDGIASSWSVVRGLVVYSVKLDFKSTL